MINITLICLGRLKDRFLEDASDEYLKRLRTYAKLSVIEVRAETLSDTPSDNEIISALNKEADEIIKKIPAGACVVPMCIEGRQLSSEEFADMFRKRSLEGTSSFAFIIGSSYGLSERVKSLASLKLSMSKMTFPHRLARIMLLEQIYRAMKICAGEKYHK